MMMTYLTGWEMPRWFNKAQSRLQFRDSHIVRVLICGRVCLLGSRILELGGRVAGDGPLGQCPPVELHLILPVVASLSSSHSGSQLCFLGTMTSHHMLCHQVRQQGLWTEGGSRSKQERHLAFPTQSTSLQSYVSLWHILKYVNDKECWVTFTHLLPPLPNLWKIREIYVDVHVRIHSTRRKGQVSLPYVSLHQTAEPWLPWKMDEKWFQSFY